MSDEEICKFQKRMLKLRDCRDCRHCKDYSSWQTACLHPKVLENYWNPNGRPIPWQARTEEHEELGHFPKFCPLTIIEERGWKPPLMVTDLTSQLENDIKKAKAEADSANKFHLYYDYSQAMNKVIKLQKTLDLIREAMV